MSTENSYNYSNPELQPRSLHGNGKARYSEDSRSARGADQRLQPCACVGRDARVRPVAQAPHRRRARAGASGGAMLNDVNRHADAEPTPDTEAGSATAGSPMSAKRNSRAGMLPLDCQRGG